MEDQHQVCVVSTRQCLHQESYRGREQCQDIVIVRIAFLGYNLLLELRFDLRERGFK